MNTRRLALLFILFLVAGNLFLAAQGQHYRWKAVLVAAANNDGLENWDHARMAVGDELLARGLDPAAIVMLSAHPDYIGTSYQGSDVQKAYSYNVKFAIEDLNLGAGDALFIYFSSHGAQNGGIALSLSKSFISISQLRSILDEVPQGVPTVVVISTCFSGQFIQGENPSASNFEDEGTICGPMRVVLTAARNDRTSFGCGSGDFMPSWDESLVAALRQKKAAQTFQDLYAAILRSISDKESGWDEGEFSYPQAYFGEKVRNLTLP